jgi:aspartate racemase
MRNIGLMGGMSWNSSAEYYRLINELVSKRWGGFHSAKLVLLNLDFEEIKSAQNEGHLDKIATILTEAGMALQRAGADFLVMCTNTMHKFADEVEIKSGLPLLHITDVVGRAIKDYEMLRVGLLGTQFTMEDPFYRGRLKDRFGLEVLTPEAEDRTIINHVIYDELCQGKVKMSSRHLCNEIMKKLAERGAQGIILGCTELPLLIQSSDATVPLFNTTRLHAEAAVNLAWASE